MMSGNSGNWLAVQNENNNIEDADDSDYYDEEPQLSATDGNNNYGTCGGNNDFNDSEDDDDDVTDGQNECNDNETACTTSKDRYTGKDGHTQWSTKIPISKTQKKNFLQEKPGVTSLAKDAQTPLAAWELYFDVAIIDKILGYTNDKLKIFQNKYQRSRDCSLISVEEIRALFGLLYLTGSLKLSHTNTRQLWASDGTAPEFFKAVMSENRFRLLLRALRFDDLESRAARSQFDKLAPIRELLDNMNTKFLTMYKLGECVTLDEMIFPTKSKCSFRQYLPMKPHSYGLKVFSLVDAKSFYVAFLEVYTGKQAPGPFFIDNKTALIMKRVAASILGTGRNITMDNWFSSIPLIDELQNNHQTTVVATLKKNKRELPPEFVNAKKRPVYSSLTAYNDGKILTSYIPKKNKSVLVVSSMHQSSAIDTTTGKKQKPEIITFYNNTKGGVDTVDQLRSNYTVARCSCRWPMSIFFGILDITGINSQIIYTSNRNIVLTRTDYLMSIAKALTTPLMLTRWQIPNISKYLRDTIARIADIKEENLKASFSASRNLCSYCPKKKNRKTIVRCSYCLNYICGEHKRSVCTKCFDINCSIED